MTQCQGPSFVRHAAFVGPEDFIDTVNIIGCGATGSNTAVLLAKMGAQRISLWDADLVEEHNLPNQAFDVEHIGKSKVEALARVLKRFNPSIEVEVHREWFTSDKAEGMSGPLILTTDTMSSRKDIYNAFYMNSEITYVFETRLGFDYGELWILDNTNPLDCIAWKNTLVDDEDVPDGPCNLRICTTLVMLVSSVLVHNISNMYAAARTEEKEWTPEKKTSFFLGDQLRILKQKK